MSKKFCYDGKGIGGLCHDSKEAEEKKESQSKSQKGKRQKTADTCAGGRVSDHHYSDCDADQLSGEQIQSLR